MNEKNIFLYWDNKPGVKTPEYISMCQETIEKNKGDGIKLNIVNKNNITDYLDDLPVNLFKLKEIAHVADYVRIALLVRYGGIWLDSDCILLKSLNPIFEKLKQYEYVGYSWKDLQPSLGFMASIKDCKFLSEHLFAIRKKIDRLTQFNNLRWQEFGYDSLWNITPKYRKDIFLYEHKYFSPIHFSKSVRSFLEYDSSESFNHCFSVMLFNKMFSHSNLSNLTKQEILKCNNLLSTLLKKALKIENCI